MMKDFMLTQTGDLMFVTEKRTSSRVKIKFLFSESPVVKLQFYIDGCHSIQPSENQIKLSFDITDQKTTHSVKLAEKKECARQAAIIRFRTSRGELAERTQIGSRLEMIKHNYLFSEQTNSSAVAIAKEALYDIMPYATVTAVPVAKHTPNGYRQVMLLKIYDEDTIILEYELG